MSYQLKRHNQLKRYYTLSLQFLHLDMWFSEVAAAGGSRHR